MDKRYPAPPLVEAVCEFHFSQDSLWDLVIPGLLYEKLSTRLPKRRMGPRELQILMPGAGPVQKSFLESAQFESLDGRCFARVSAHLLSVHHVRPYDSWEDFSRLIADCYEAYLEVAGPKGVDRLVLRYLNIIEIPAENLELQDYFNFYPHTGDDLKDAVDSFTVGIQIPFDEHEDKLRLQLTSLGGEGGLRASLEISHLHLAACEWARGELAEWLSRAHDKIKQAFESCITDALRESFTKGMETPHDHDPS